MIFDRRGWWLVLLALVVFGLPVLGHLARGRPESTCALDGAPIDPACRVQIVDCRSRPHVFCCILCGQRWLEQQNEAPQTVRVAEEPSGRMIDAAGAWFVRSAVVNVPHTGNRIHAFAREGDARRHAAAQRGVVLPDDERPLQWRP